MISSALLKDTLFLIKNGAICELLSLGLLHLTQHIFIYDWKIWRQKNICKFPSKLCALTHTLAMILCYFPLCAVSVIIKRCFKCVSNQKCSTGNLQSLRGRCEMCSPCHFCHDRSTLHALLCQIPPLSRYSSSWALDWLVRKPRETSSSCQPWPICWPQERITNKKYSCEYHWETSLNSGLLGKVDIIRNQRWQIRDVLTLNEGMNVGRILRSILFYLLQ